MKRSWGKGVWGDETGTAIQRAVTVAHDSDESVRGRHFARHGWTEGEEVEMNRHGQPTKEDTWPPTAILVSPQATEASVHENGVTAVVPPNWDTLAKAMSNPFLGENRATAAQIVTAVNNQMNWIE